MENILTKSDSFKEEYCCTVVRIGDLIPVEGSDFLVKTNILGTQIVLNKTSVKDGDIVFYSSNETALNKKFLSVNNLFEIGCRENNSNYPEVKAIMDDYDINYRKDADDYRNKAKEIKSRINSFTNNAARYNKQIKKLQKELEEYNTGVRTPGTDTIESLQLQIKEKKEKADNVTSMAMKLTVDYTEYKNKVESLVNAGKPIVDKAKQLCGFFNKYGRVRCITLRGEPSFGFVFGIDEMAKYCPEIKNINIEEYLNEDFDTVNGELFVKAFVPPIKPQNEKKSRNEKRSKKLSRFDRLVGGEFEFHYDTFQLGKNIHRFTPDMEVCCSVKIHGTSEIIGKLHVKEPKKIAFYKKLWNLFVDNTGLFKSSRITDYNIVYGPVYSSRTVIKNRYINNDVNSGYYSQDIWSEYGDIIYPYLENGMAVYGEIFGYLSGSQSMIQKHYDYGCQEGQNKIMLYRISVINEDGSKREFEVSEVYEWTLGLIERMKENGDENYKRIHPIDILYQGTLGELYPELDPSEHWNENVLEKLKKDTEHFGMEQLEPLCNNEVPREGFVIRIVNDEINEAFKLKTDSYKLKEALLVDSGDVDCEMLDNYGNIAMEEC